ncbi:MAG TPA: energy-coupling factor ABC transporter substrate-binding protein [Methanothermococcus okinawensis]|nr:energy-coupling factor ABC transporter substrate-binding protein [Methanothermococcus okinawensis]
METKHILMLLGVIIITVIPFLMYSGKGEKQGYFEGSDDLGEEAILKINPHYKPWFRPIWEPPSGEIESLLFSVQAAIGAIIIGYFVGYNKAKIEVKSRNQ